MLPLFNLLPRHDYWFLLSETVPMIIILSMIFRIARRGIFDKWDWLFWIAVFANMYLRPLAKASQSVAGVVEWASTIIMSILVLKVIFGLVRHRISPSSSK